MNRDTQLIYEAMSRRSFLDKITKGVAAVGGKIIPVNHMLTQLTGGQDFGAQIKELLDSLRDKLIPITVHKGKIRGLNPKALSHWGVGVERGLSVKDVEAGNAGEGWLKPRGDGMYVDEQAILGLVYNQPVTMFVPAGNLLDGFPGDNKMSMFEAFFIGKFKETLHAMYSDEFDVYSALSAMSEPWLPEEYEKDIPKHSKFTMLGNRAWSKTASDERDEAKTNAMDRYLTDSNLSLENLIQAQIQGIRNYYEDIMGAPVPTVFEEVANKQLQISRREDVERQQRVKKQQDEPQIDYSPFDYAGGSNPEVSPPGAGYTADSYNIKTDADLIFEAYVTELFDKPYKVSGPQRVGNYTIMYTFHTDPNEDGHSPPIYVTFGNMDFKDKARTLGDAWSEITSHIQENYPDSVLPENVVMQEFGFGQSPDEDGMLDFNLTSDQGHSASKLIGTLLQISERHSRGKNAPHIIEISASNAPADEHRGPIYRKLVDRFIATHPEWGVIQTSNDQYDRFYVYNKNYVPWLEDEKLKEFIELP